MPLDIQTKAGERLLRELWESAPDSYFVVRLEHDVFYLDAINPAQARVFGLNFRDVVDKPLRDILPVGYADRIIENYRHCINLGKLYCT